MVCLIKIGFQYTPNILQGTIGSDILKVYCPILRFMPSDKSFTYKTSARFVNETCVFRHKMTYGPTLVKLIM